MNSAEIITIGDELLIGQTIDTNSAWMGMQLSMKGIRVNRITSISDSREGIIAALDESLRRVPLVLMTGGLGPTSDDITKETLAEYFGTKLVMDQGVLEEVTARIKRRNLEMNENNRRQAMVPESCRVLANHAGTAPAMLFEKEGRIIVSMPGVPSEMKQIMQEHVLPMISAMAGGHTIIHRNIMTFGTFEAKLAERLEGFEKELPAMVKLAYLPAHGIIKLRLTGTGDDPELVRMTEEEQVRKLYSIIPEVIYGEDEVTLEEIVGKLLLDNNLTVSTAESCTGGKIASMITSVPGSSAWYRGSVVAYDNSIKTGVLGVDPGIISRYGAVSEETVRAMAERMRSIAETDYAIAVTGIAGPTGGTPEKPAGTVWIAVASASGVVAEKHRFADDRQVNISRSATNALNLLRKQIISR
ncbi:MAG TPA: competence/damage-inducible protein A [Bacteroidales bacterium]|jgi:nicotinamide-nucleotide amidase|nr:competence/damage-inducible protein A [Bacteroidales bacterium]HNX85090.1 competence/damage-inducible protein A [Bacteroidales bacterium]HOC48852.1 competence/damage-inducible protein A [Bacteroidales bacterium]HPS98899.1 competence/damage-inducible protein A [Bacteroidales bacterium]